MLRVAWVGGFFFGTLPFMIAAQLFLARIKSRWWGPSSVGYYRLLRKALRIRVKVEGAALSGQPVLLVANHVSWADIVVLASLAPMVFVAKREVSNWPLIGAAARAQKVVFVDRTRRQQTPVAVAEIAQRLAEGHPVVLARREYRRFA
jgi:1-acyl-sn-glycerol-3-phosphate acyltransferase